MSVKFNTTIQEVAFLKLFLAHDFDRDQDVIEKEKRIKELKPDRYTEKELAPFYKEIGRSRAGSVQNLLKEIFSVEQLKLIDREVYLRMEGKCTPDFAKKLQAAK